MVVAVSRPFCWVCLPFDRHRIPNSTLSSLRESLATIILREVPSTWSLFLHSVLLPIPRGLMLKFLVVRTLTCTFVKCYLRPFYIDVMRSVDSRLRELPGSSSVRWYILAARYLCSSTGSSLWSSHQQSVLRITGHPKICLLGLWVLLHLWPVIGGQVLHSIFFIWLLLRSQIIEIKITIDKFSPPTLAYWLGISGLSDLWTS